MPNLVTHAEAKTVAVEVVAKRIRDPAPAAWWGGVDADAELVVREGYEKRLRASVSGFKSAGSHPRP